MPRIDTGVGEACLSIASMMKFGVLLHGRFEVGTVLARRSAHPLFDGGRGYDRHPMILGCLQSGEKLVCHCGLVLGIHGIGTAYHQNKIEIQVEILDAITDLIKVLGLSAGNHR